MAHTSRLARNLADLLQNYEPSAQPENRQEPRPASDGTWSTAEVARFCRVSPSSVRKWVRLSLLRADRGRIADSDLQVILRNGLDLPTPDLAASLHPRWAEEVA